MVISPATPVVTPEKRGESQDPSPLVTQMLQREIAHAEKLTDIKLSGLRTEVYTTLFGKDKALELQANEYERRLVDLNHAHLQAVQRYATFLPREIYERHVQDYNDWRRTIDAERAANTGQRSAYLAIMAAGMSLLSLAFVAWGLWR